MSETDSKTTSETERFRPYLLGCSLVAALGGLLFGFDTAVISGTTEALRAEFSLTDGTLGFTVASALIGTILGSLLAGKPADWFGRRPVLVWLGYSISFLHSGAPLRGIGGALFRSDSWEDLPWEGPPWSLRSTPPRFRRLASEAGWWRLLSLMSC